MTSPSAASVSLHERCQYPNKQCANRRMSKRNGQLHRLCVEHREIANRNQRRWLKTRVRQAKAKTNCPTMPHGPPANTESNAVIDPLDNAMALSGGDSSLDDFEKMLLDEDEFNEFLKDLLLTPDELRALHEDVIKECYFLNG